MVPQPGHCGIAGALERCRRHPAVSLLLGYALLCLPFTAELLIPARSLFRWDTLLYNWPLLLETRREWLAGRFPFWSESFCCGTPLLENINAAVLYPLKLIVWVLPLKSGYHAFLFVHVWLSLVGMHLLLRKGARVGVVAAVVGALAYGAGGYARDMWDTHNFTALPWIPLGLFALTQAGAGCRRYPAALGVAVCWAMLVLGGDLQAAALWLPCALLLALGSRGRRDRIVVLAAGIAVGTLISAPQWLPSAASAAESYRSGGLSLADAAERSFHPLRTLELALPHLFGNRDLWFGESLAGDHAQKKQPWVSSFHFGLLAVPLLALALRRPRSPAARWALVIGLAGLLLGYGRFTPLFRYWHALPVVDLFRFPEKYLLWTSLGGAVLTGLGAQRFLAASRNRRLARRLRGVVATWVILHIVAAGLAAWAALAVGRAAEPALAAWLVGRLAATLFTLTVLAAGLLWLTRTRRRPAVLAVLAVFDLAALWYLEAPTTSSWQPLALPEVASMVRQSDSPRGRFLRDPAVRFPFAVAGENGLRESVASSVRYQQALWFNSARLWGMRIADGFSPSEAAAMVDYRKTQLGVEPGVPEPGSLAEFCRSSAIEWLLTTPERAEKLRALGVDADTVGQWGDPASVTLVRLQRVKPVDIRPIDEASAPLPLVADMWRPRPDFIRVDLEPGAAAVLKISESYSRGWRAHAQNGDELSTSLIDQAFLGVSLPEGVRQVRLSYRPVAWEAAVLVGGLGFLCLCVLLFLCCGGDRLGIIARQPAAPAVAACVVFGVLGVSARSHWACTFDEGFHLARGYALSASGDSRLSYFHPPLQNRLAGYFARLAVGDMTLAPDSPGWQRADVYRYSVEFASVNRDVFPDLVSASRWGTLPFSLLLCTVIVVWAHRAAGPAAAWLAAAGFCLNPNLVAHGDLTTTDMGVTALVCAGTFLLWSHTRAESFFRLALAGVAFAAAAAAKFTGLLWLAAYLLLAVPLAAWSARRPRWLMAAPLAFATLLLLLGELYGPALQTVRAPGTIWDGITIPAGRYLEGVVAQSAHALEGQRAYFGGRQFEQGRWWYLPAIFILKSPAVWSVAMLGCVWSWIRKARTVAAWIPWLPALVFMVSVLSANRLVLGLRHLLPFTALGVVAAAVWAGGMDKAAWRKAAALLLLLSAAVSTAVSYPKFISFYPMWAGGADKGHRWAVDSNYDWGQELGEVESQWAALTEANQGRPPRLLYFGFVDPAWVYRMPVSEPSLGGHMGRYREMAKGEKAYEEWIESLGSPDGPVVSSISALRLAPYGMDASTLSGTPVLGRLSTCYVVLHDSADSN